MCVNVKAFHFCKNTLDIWACVCLWICAIFSIPPLKSCKSYILYGEGYKQRHEVAIPEDEQRSMFDHSI